MSSRTIRFALGMIMVSGLAATSIAVAAGHGHKGKKDDQQFTAHLIGFNEVPSLNSPAQADLTLTVGSGQLTWSLTYSGFVNQPSQAHVHIGQPGVAGGVSFFFCGGSGKAACPSSASGPVTITGTTVAADIQAIAAQGFVAGQLDPVVAAIEAGFTYANMHTSVFPAGEIRGQLEPGHGHGHDGHGDND